MKNGKGKSNGGLVYSTGPKQNSWDEDADQHENRQPADQLLYVSIDRKHRKGKEVTLIEGFNGPDSDLIELARTLKAKCGTGGSAKEGNILIQGNLREKVIQHLEAQGYSVKRKGG